MTLDELDDQLKKVAKPVVITPVPSIIHSTPYVDWMTQRKHEDDRLKMLKCPICTKDVRLRMIGAVSYYTCTDDKNHHFTRFDSPLPTVGHGYHNDEFWD